ncbi:hypothetical protein K438DRAFT_1759197 [Mycena galopus ATCC 62051]|nr:hypothetical protein K438DRAFT_1759197 [Mycena galopus ATCC 62051]
MFDWRCTFFDLPRMPLLFNPITTCPHPTRRDWTRGDPTRPYSGMQGTREGAARKRNGGCGKASAQATSRTGQQRFPPNLPISCCAIQSPSISTHPHAILPLFLSPPFLAPDPDPVARLDLESTVIGIDGRNALAGEARDGIGEGVTKRRGVEVSRRGVENSHVETKSAAAAAGHGHSQPVQDGAVKHEAGVAGGGCGGSAAPGAGIDAEGHVKVKRWRACAQKGTWEENRDD